MTTLHDFRMKGLDGDFHELSSFSGAVVLVVNVASKCGLTPQYEGLEKLYQKYRERGFSVLGFPCNQFGAQEPGTSEEIQSFCTTNYGVLFPMFEKIEVNGASAHELYRWLTTQPTEPDGPGSIKWNFAKFLVGKDGSVIARFAPPVDPMDKDIVSRIEEALA